jgi:hypothetical protein
MSEPAKLLPCPWCPDGGRPYLVSTISGKTHWVVCAGCESCHPGQCDTAEEAWSEWNTRSTESRLAQAEQALAELRAIAGSLATAAKMMGLEDNDFALKQFTEWKDRNP